MIVLLTKKIKDELPMSDFLYNYKVDSYSCSFSFDHTRKFKSLVPTVLNTCYNNFWRMFKIHLSLLLKLCFDFVQRSRWLRIWWFGIRVRLRRWILSRRWTRYANHLCILYLLLLRRGRREFKVITFVN